MGLKITSLEKAPQHYEWASYVVSTIDPSKRVGYAGKGKHLVLHFEDTEQEFELRSPQPWHVQRLFQWFEERQVTLNDNLLFHCHAGVSRSTAMAWSALLWMKIPIEDAFQQVVAGADNRVWPNLLILSYTDHILQLDGALNQFALEMDKKIHSERTYGIYGGMN
jgi:predicted protein tyrosine phosphatase